MAGSLCVPTASLIADCLKESLQKHGQHQDEEGAAAVLGLDELRCLDPALSRRRLWEQEDRGGANASRGLLRFGSPQERALHVGMRLLALAELFFAPFVFAFDPVYPLRTSPAAICLDMLLTLCYAAGVALRLRTTFVRARDAVECKDADEIRRQVCRETGFKADCLALLAVPALYITGPLSPLFVLRLLKCWRLPEHQQRLILLRSTASHSIARQILQIIVAILAAMHLYGCIWFVAKVASPLGSGREWSAWNGWSKNVFIPDHSDEGGLSLPIEPGDLSDLWWCYIRALRDGAYMLVGWSGPNALSPVELVTVCILGPSGACIMACVYGFVVDAISQYRILESRFQERAEILNKACRGMHLPPSLVARIHHYHSYMEMLSLGVDAQSLFAQLSPNLTCEMRMFRMRGVLCSASIFQGLEPRISLMLAQTCIEQVFSPGDMVVRKGEVGDCMYIILRGTVSVLPDQAAEKVVMRLGEAECFGEICLLRQQMLRSAWVRAQTFCVLWRLDKDRMDALLNGRRDLQQKVYSRILTKVGRLVEADGLKTYLSDIGVRSRSIATSQYSHFDSDYTSFPGDVPLPPECMDEEPSEPPPAAPPAGQRSPANRRWSVNTDATGSRYTEVYYTRDGVQTDESTPLMTDRDDPEEDLAQLPDAQAEPSGPPAGGPRAREQRGSRRVSITESLTGGLIQELRDSSFPHLRRASQPALLQRSVTVGSRVEADANLQAQLSSLSQRLDAVQGLLAQSVLPRLGRIEAALPCASFEAAAATGASAMTTTGPTAGLAAGSSAAASGGCHARHATVNEVAVGG